MEAFGRPQDFDPKTDTIVRVQIHRLRQKLTEDYDSDGSRDPILVEIPKGHYLPTFEPVADSDRNKKRDSTPELNANAPAVTPQIGTITERVGSDAGQENRHLGGFFFSRMAIAAAAVILFSRHELIHVRRKDWLLTVLEEVTLAAYWFLSRRMVAGIPNPACPRTDG